jgi:uncharacterized repeat protein (TIGR02543 family)
MKKYVKVSLLILFASIFALAAAACCDTVTGDITLYAKWNPITYKVTFESDGGSAVTAARVIRGYKTAEPVAPTKAGYDFGGWYKENGLNNLWDFDTDTVTGDITLYAKWELRGTDGLIYALNDGNDSYSVIGYNGQATDIIIPETHEGLPVTSIADNAFKEKSITSVVIPSGVTSIGSNAFQSCYSLASIAIPASVTSIGTYAFYGTSLTIYARAASQPSGWASYWNDFRPVYWGINESNYYEDGEGVQYVIEGGSAILTRVPKGAESVTIPNSITIGSSVYSVTSIGNSAFRECASLAGIEIPASVTSIGYGAFRECDSLASIEIPTSVTSISSFAFYHCDRLAGIEIPEGVTSIGNGAFERCGSLKSVTMNRVTPPILGILAFSDTPDDMKIYVPSGSEDTYKSASVWSGYSDRITAKA